MKFERDDIEKYVQDEQREIWQVIGWQEQPSVTIQNVKTKEMKSMAYSCRLADEYTRLVRDE